MTAHRGSLRSGAVRAPYPEFREHLSLSSVSSQVSFLARKGEAMDRFIVISGCSGGGKSTLLSELKRRGHAVMEEPGRRIIADELQGSGQALPWINLTAFAERAVEMSLCD